MITKTTTRTILTVIALMMVAAFVAFPLDAFAQSVDLKDQTQQIGKQIATVPKLIALASYVIGAFLAVKTIFAILAWAKEPDKNPITNVLGTGAAAALLILLPYIIGVMTQSITNGQNNAPQKGSQQQFDDSTW